MKRTLSLLLLCLLLVLSGCQGGDSPGDGSSAAGDGSSLPAGNGKDGVDVEADYVFEVTPLEGSGTEILAFPGNSRAKPGYLIDILPGATLADAGANDWGHYYTVTAEGNVGSMTVSLLSCPDDAMDFFGVSTQAELDNKLLAYIFSTEDRHNGQLKAVEDFAYQLAVDYYGEREGWKAFVVEFLVPEENVHSIRFLSANDAIDEDYAAVGVNIDLPMDESQVYEDYMAMLYSIRRDQ